MAHNTYSEASTVLRTRSKRARRTTGDDESLSNFDQMLGESEFPPEFEGLLASTIFDIGLRHSSPKILINIMDQNPLLNTEHIKSHLQKYRIHHDRSQDEFLHHYSTMVMTQFHEWEAAQDWSSTDPQQTATSSSKRLHDDQEADDDSRNGELMSDLTSMKSLLEAEQLLSSCSQAFKEAYADCEAFMRQFHQEAFQ